MLYDELEGGDKLFYPFKWLCYLCGTCGGLNMFGAFFDVDMQFDSLNRAKLHPKGSDILPPPHTLSPAQPVPPKCFNFMRRSGLFDIEHQPLLLVKCEGCSSLCVPSRAPPVKTFSRN